ncbi:MAG: 7-cyano-7-deazaguanine synthase, partial [Methanoculleus sp.]
MEMVTEETIVCNYPAYVGEDVKRLNLFGTDTVNVFPQISLFKEYFKNINPRLIDFVEIATFIYVADQMIVRCQNRVDPHGFLWRRKFNMVVAVQDYDFWCRADVTKTLERLLRFLSDDCFHFQFVKMTEKHPEQEYFIFDQVMGSARPPQRVMLFSGGLDSLGGAIQSLLGEGLQTVLVRHKAIRKHKARFAKLERELTKRSGNRGKFITFKAGKDGSLTKEYTQRSRSLLYFAFGATIAHLLGLKELLFFENGPVSFNLPMSPQVVGARATRTTHPQTLFFFQELIRKVSDIPDFIVRNPFLNMKKSEIVSLIISHNCGDLIKESMSCAHSWQQDKESKHCGTCSQCIDRRVAIIAAGAENYDNLKDYRVDFFTESVDKNHIDCFEAPNKNLLASFFLKGAQIEAYQNYEQFEQAFPEICDALLYMDKEAKFSAQEIYRLNRSLADDIRKVAQYATSEKFQIRMRDINNPLPTDCLCYILTRPSGT